jgi:hypothetical protein
MTNLQENNHAQHPIVYSRIIIPVAIVLAFLLGAASVYLFNGTIKTFISNLIGQSVSNDNPTADGSQFSTYAEPDYDKFMSMNFPQIPGTLRDYSPIFAKIETSNLPASSKGVIEEVFKSWTDLEAYFITEVGTTMGRVQSLASERSYLELFNHMKVAREINNEAMVRTLDTRNKISLAIDANLPAPTQSEKDRMDALFKKGYDLSIRAEELVNLNLSVLRTSPPTQNELDKLAELTAVVTTAVNEIVKEIEELIDNA